MSKENAIYALAQIMRHKSVTTTEGYVNSLPLDIYSKGAENLYNLF